MNIAMESGIPFDVLKKDAYSKSQMNSGSVKGAVLLDRPMLLFSKEKDSLWVLLNNIIP